MNTKSQSNVEITELEAHRLDSHLYKCGGNKYYVEQTSPGSENYNIFVLRRFRTLFKTEHEWIELPGTFTLKGAEKEIKELNAIGKIRTKKETTHDQH